jgi:hypothetical protein
VLHRFRRRQPPKRILRRERIGPLNRCSAKACGTLCMATERKAPSSWSASMPKWAAHSFVAFARMVSKTGSSLVGEFDMTRSTSAVAVCCSSDSVRSAVRWRSSFNNRAFSIAITASAACVCGRGLVRSRARRDAGVSP